MNYTMHALFKGIVDRYGKNPDKLTEILKNLANIHEMWRWGHSDGTQEIYFLQRHWPEEIGEIAADILVGEVSFDDLYDLVQRVLEGEDVEELHDPCPVSPCPAGMGKGRKEYIMTEEELKLIEKHKELSNLFEQIPGDLQNPRALWILLGDLKKTLVEKELTRFAGLRTPPYARNQQGR